MIIRNEQDEIVEPNITPMIDMVFLLLIFFLLATKFADIERDVRVKPPSGRHARPITAVPQEIVVNVGRDGSLIMAGRKYSLKAIDRLLGKAAAGNPRQAVVIRGDRKAVLQFAVNVLDLCEKHGIKHTYLTTRVEEP